MADQVKVMISSTVVDLPEHRAAVRDACLRQYMFPLLMENLPAKDADAIRVSLGMVDQAQVYVGIFGHRYGHVPTGYTVSISEMEYDRARERNIPRLIFLMHDDHPIKKADVDTGENATRLETLKKRLGTDQVVNFFKSVDDLRGQVINSLSQLHQRDVTTFHHVSDIPRPPARYIAHPYTLMQTPRLVGRQTELNLLTDWVAARTTDVYRARILNVVAIGGMGKSALTWTWFNDIAPHEMQPLAGRMWWSFYESDASFDNFIVRALAYVTARPREEVQQIPRGDREDQLLAVLDRQAFLIVLDGLERILIAYARMDAARLADDDLDERTANIVAGAAGLPASAAQSFVGQHRLRTTADPRAGTFLRKLADVRATRVLVSTRLYPLALQTPTGQAVPGSFPYFLRGLGDDDALNLWRMHEVSGSREALLPLFHTFDDHPLLIQALASEVANDRRAPGDFDAWRRNHPGFNPFRLPLIAVKSHVLEYALGGLSPAVRRVLDTNAAFRMPTRYDTLAALLIGENRPFLDDRALDAALVELEDRGLLGWDRRANRYDLHPVVRGVVWSALSHPDRQSIYGTLHAHFEAIPAIDEDNVTNLDELTPTIELYSTLIGLRRYDDAFSVFDDRLVSPLLLRGGGRQACELLEMLFPDGLEQLPAIDDAEKVVTLLYYLGVSYAITGQPLLASSLYGRELTSDRITTQDDYDATMTLVFMTYSLVQAGAIRQATAAAHRSLDMAVSQDDSSIKVLSILGVLTCEVIRGMTANWDMLLAESLQLYTRSNDPYSNDETNQWILCDIIQLPLWLGDNSFACSTRDIWLKEFQTRPVSDIRRNFWIAIRLRCLESIIALHLDDLATAERVLSDPLARARATNQIGEELPVLVALAELWRRKGDLKVARDLLDDVWEPAKRGPYPIVHADACNVLAQIERDAGDHAAAVAAATRAYRLAWCDGPPFAYHWGLEAARAHLTALEAPEPTDLPPFDESRYEPLIDITDALSEVRDYLLSLQTATDPERVHSSAGGMNDHELS